MCYNEQVKKSINLFLFFFIILVGTGFLIHCDGILGNLTIKFLIHGGFN